MTYEELAVRWLLRRANREDLLSVVDWANPPVVNFEPNDGTVYSSMSADSAYLTADARIGGQSITVDLGFGMSVPELLREIIPPEYRQPT